jgi:glycosyltransferase involved in cell wall biosynthesis
MDLAKSPTIEVLLIAPEVTHDILKNRYANTPVQTALPEDIRKYELHVAWHPWGAINFDCDAPAVLTLHNLSLVESPPTGFFTARKAKQIHERDVREAVAIIALSEWSREQLSAGLNIDPFAIVVAPPLPDASWSPGFQELTNLQLGEQPYVLSIAGWQDHHAMELVINTHHRAFHKEEITLAIYGPVNDHVKKKLSKLPHVVHIDNMLNDRELRGLYRNARAVIHPATNSHWSQVAAEALCCGAPLIACDNASLIEIVGTAGFLVPEDNHDAWTSTVGEVVRNQDLNRELRIAAEERWGQRSRMTSVQILTELFHSVAIKDE